MSRGNRGGRGGRGSQGRGFDNARGRGRGGRRGGGRGRGRGRGGVGYDDDLDFVVQSWPARATDGRNDSGRGFDSPRGGGGQQYSNNTTGVTTPVDQRGMTTPRGRGRGRGEIDMNTPSSGRGRGRKVFNRNAPLSKLLYQDRPFLKPITFVRSEQTPMLFREQEEIMQPLVESADQAEESHVPTAERVAQVFSAGNGRRSLEDDTHTGTDELEEIDFEDMGRIREEVDAMAASVPHEFEKESQTHMHTQGEDEAQTDVNITSVEENVISAGLEPTSIMDGVFVETKTEVRITSQAEPRLEAEVAEDEVEADVSITPVGEKVTFVGPEPTSTLDGVLGETETEVQITSQTDRVEAEVAEDEVEADVNITPVEQKVTFAGPEPTSIMDGILGETETEVQITSQTEPRVEAEVAEDEMEDVNMTSVEEKVTFVGPEPTSTMNSVFVETRTEVQIASQDESRVEAEVAAVGENSMITQDEPHAEEEVEAAEENLAPFFIDTNRTPVANAPGPDSVVFNRMEGCVPIGEKMDQEEIIVYVAPHQRSGKASLSAQETPVASTSQLPAMPTFPSTSNTDHFISRPPSPSALPAPSFSSVSFSFTDSPSKQQSRQYSNRPRSLLKKRKHPRTAKKSRRLKGGLFGSFGAAREEALLWDSDGKEFDPRRDEQRRGDSDVEWGDEDEGEVGTGDVGDMDVEVEVGVEMMKMFVNGMDGNHVTMDDLADEERMRLEDEESESESKVEDGDEESSSDEEAEEVFAEEEHMLIAESGSLQSESADEDEDKDGSEDSDEDDGSPKHSFQARLERLRSRSKGKQVATDPMALVDDDSDDSDDNLVTAVQAFVNGNNDILSALDNKNKGLFWAIRDGDFEDMEGFSPVKRKKDKNVPPELHEQWQRDRAKKAERKRQRAQARLADAADPLSPKKGGKKGRKAMRAAARLDPSIEIPNRVVDMVSLEVQIRRFTADIGGRSSMALPPCDKETRKNVHELAAAFSLSSKSKGSGANRYTTLSKTSRTGVLIDERKVRKIMRGYRSVGASGSADGWAGPNANKRVNVAPPRHREGDEVGKAAPKIDGTNVGFKMLAAMGWSDGDRIGLSGGLDAPLAAVYKKSKLGLGAIQ